MLLETVKLLNNVGLKSVELKSVELKSVELRSVGQFEVHEYPGASES